MELKLIQNPHIYKEFGRRILAPDIKLFHG